MRLACALDFDADALQRQTNGRPRLLDGKSHCKKLRILVQQLVRKMLRRRLDKLERMAAQIGVDLMAHLAIVNRFT